MLVGITRDLGEMLHGLPHHATLEISLELAGTFIAAASVVSRTADAVRAELEKATRE